MFHAEVRCADVVVHSKILARVIHVSAQPMQTWRRASTTRRDDYRWRTGRAASATLRTRCVPRASFSHVTAPGTCDFRPASALPAPVLARALALIASVALSLTQLQALSRYTRACLAGQYHRRAGQGESWGGRRTSARAAAGVPARTCARSWTATDARAAPMSVSAACPRGR
jgi:hypothetical protein